MDIEYVVGISSLLLFWFLPELKKCWKIQGALKSDSYKRRQINIVEIKLYLRMFTCPMVEMYY